MAFPDPAFPPAVYKWDLFLAHVNADTYTIARPLADLLTAKKVRVNCDCLLHAGSSLTATLQHGLNSSRHGAVILTPNFFALQWPQTELDELGNNRIHGRGLIFPIWYGVGPEEVSQYMPRMAYRGQSVPERSLTSVAEALATKCRPFSY